VTTKKRPGSSPTDKQGVKSLGKGRGTPSIGEQLVHVGPEMLGQVLDVVKTCVECHKEIERCKTERIRFSESARVQVELIRSRREVLVEFMDRTFKERKENFRELFLRLDSALEQGNVDGTRAVLDAIVTVAKSSPFEALRDAAGAHTVLLDKNVTWEF